MKAALYPFIVVMAIWGLLSLADPYPNRDESVSAMQYVCVTLDADCTGIEPPVIIETALMQKLGLYGLTVKGEGHLFITNDDIGEEFRSVVIIHEMTHYVLFALHPDIPLCSSELLARLMESAYTGGPYDDSWRELEFYAECKIEEEPGGLSESAGHAHP